MGNQAHADAAEAAYILFNDTNMSANPDFTLNFIAQIGDSFSGAGKTSGTFSIGFLVEYLAVEADGVFVLCRLIGPASSGIWNLFNILNQSDQPFELSHLAFLGCARFDPGGNSVPVPASWALRLSGFGLVSLAARRRIGLNGTMPDRLRVNDHQAVAMTVDNNRCCSRPRS